jgi:hypothetical protein
MTLEQLNSNWKAAAYYKELGAIYAFIQSVRYSQLRCLSETLKNIRT